MSKIAAQMPMARTATQGRAARNFAYIAAGFAAIGGLLFGYDTGVVSGAELFLGNQFALTTFELEVIVSGALVGAATGAFVGGRLADLLGRRHLLIATAAIFALGAIGCAEAWSAGILIASRVVVGLGIGLSSGTVPVYISEVSTAETRGWTVTLFQLAITVGILLAYVVDYAFASIQGWRWMFGLAVVPAIAFACGMFYLPESPRWLAGQGKYDAARAVLVRIRGTLDVDTEMRGIEQTLAQTHQSGRFSDLAARSLRPALIVGLGLAVLQQVTGINTVIYYAPIIMRSAGISSVSGAILATAGIGAINVLMTLVSMRLIDRVGRRPLLLVGTAGMAVTLGILGIAFYGPERSQASTWLAVISVMAYVAFFAISLGPVFWLLISEIYPLRIRNSAEGLAATFNWGSNLLVSLTFLTLLQSLGASLTFWLYGLMAIVALVFSYRLVPETKGRTLEEIEAFWEAPLERRTQP
jgi:MFS transporter, SP family, galactose:H+ symporter